ncbi:ATP-binding protein [Paenibacillus tarimensis]
MLLTFNALLEDYAIRMELKTHTQNDMQRMAEQIQSSLKNYHYIASIIPDESQIAKIHEVTTPQIILREAARQNYGTLEITILQANKIIQADAERTDSPILDLENVVGSYVYADPDKDYGFIQAAILGQSVFHETHLLGKKVIKGYFPIDMSQSLVLRIVMDKQKVIGDIVMKQRLNQVTVSSMLLLVIILFSYWMSDIVLRPIRAILWKVNEVSSGRFDLPIQVKRKDEFGQLAARINAMSKNLDVYTAKLKQAFEENRSMKEFLESFINHTTDAIHVVDLNGRITQVNHAFEDLFEWGAEEVIGQAVPLVPDRFLADEQQALEAVKSGKIIGARETVRKTKSGEWKSVSVTTSAIRDRNGNIHAIASITRDMTGRNKMEELLRQSEKLTTVGQLAAGVAHEIRNPLTTLRGFLQLQQQTRKLNPQHNDLMLSELDRINLIVSEFLILAKPQATKFEIKDVRYVLGDVISLLDSQAHLCNIIFETDFCTERCEISCEENQLKQVFINILKNAIEAMPQGGRIRISVKWGKDHLIGIAITDEGIGIPEEMIPKLGDPFFTGKETGTGLGIMVSQRIIHHHKGTLSIRSKVNEGTTVTVTLPALEKK